MNQTLNLNPGARLLFEFLLPGLDEFLSRVFPHSPVAISPLMEHSHECFTPVPVCEISIRTQRKAYIIQAGTHNFPPDLIERFYGFVKSRVPSIRLILGMFLKKVFAVECRLYRQQDFRLGWNDSGENVFRIDISARTGAEEHVLSLRIPAGFLGLLSRNIEHGSDADLAEKEIVRFALDPISWVPRIAVILELFSDLEIRNLLYILQKRGLLTPYQLCLLVIAFPDKSQLFKKNLSSATVRDVIRMMAVINEQIPITRRDLSEGIYAVEEGVYRLLCKGEKITASRYFEDLQEIIAAMRAMELLNVKDFGQWLAEINSKGMLYHTISLTGELDTAMAISGLSEVYLPMLEGSMSALKTRELIGLSRIKIPLFREKLRAQSRFIGNYRKILVRRYNPAHTSFEYLLLGMSGPSDCNRLLLETGWFTLATACKGVRKSTLKRVLKNLYFPARCLIEDVVRGVVNPNILHDEMQVHTAQVLCAREILALAESGSVMLSA